MAHRSSLCYEDLTLRRFVVSSTRVVNWKIVCIVLCCCVQYVEIYAEQRAFADGIIFLFSFEENMLNYSDYFERFMVNMLQHKLRLNDDFDVSKVVTSTQDKKKDGNKQYP